MTTKKDPAAPLEVLKHPPLSPNSPDNLPLGKPGVGGLDAEHQTNPTWPKRDA